MSIGKIIRAHKCWIIKKIIEEWNECETILANIIYYDVNFYFWNNNRIKNT